MSTLTFLAIWAQTHIADARDRASVEAERGDIVADVIKIAGFVVLAGAIVAFVTLYVQGKLDALP